MVTSAPEITEITINGKLFEETKEAFEYWCELKEQEVEMDFVTWGKRIYSKCIHNVLSVKRAEE